MRWRCAAREDAESAVQAEGGEENKRRIEKDLNIYRHAYRSLRAQVTSM